MCVSKTTGRSSFSTAAAQSSPRARCRPPRRTGRGGHRRLAESPRECFLAAQSPAVLIQIHSPQSSSHSFHSLQGAPAGLAHEAPLRSHSSRDLVNEGSTCVELVRRASQSSGLTTGIDNKRESSLPQFGPARKRARNAPFPSAQLESELDLITRFLAWQLAAAHYWDACTTKSRCEANANPWRREDAPGRCGCAARARRGGLWSSPSRRVIGHHGDVLESI